MIGRLLKLCGALLVPLALAGCVLAPGKFTSTLRIDADGHFAFSYVGEVYAVDTDQIGAAFAGMKSNPPIADKKADPNGPIVQRPPDADRRAAERRAQTDTKNRAIADALGKEAGYRKVTYLGEGKFLIDYAIAGTLDHAFVFPYNTDAEAIFPFIAIEPRQGGTVRVKAPGFSNDSSQKSAGLPGADAGTSKLDGTFTLDTDATVVSQNSEDGAKPGAGGRQTIAWKATPLTRDAPTAVLKLR